MDAIHCPITGEKIISIGANGVRKRENYAEVWFKLSDGSRMRVAMSKNAKAQLKESDADEVYRKIKQGWTEAIQSKVLPAKQKTAQLSNIDKLTFSKVETRAGILIDKKQKDGTK
jgi:hypothetical protein